MADTVDYVNAIWHRLAVLRWITPMPSLVAPAEDTIDLETLLDVIARSNELSYRELLTIAHVDRDRFNVMLKDLMQSRLITISGIRSAAEIDQVLSSATVDSVLGPAQPDPKVTISNRGFSRAMAL